MLLGFKSLNIAEPMFSHWLYLRGSTLDIEPGDLLFKLTDLQLSALVSMINRENCIFRLLLDNV